MKKYIRFALLALASIVTLAAVSPPRPSDTDVVQLGWDYTQGENPAVKFRVYHGREPGVYAGAVDTADLSTSAIVPVDAPGDWYFVATAISADGLESLPSNEVKTTIRTRPNKPTNMQGSRITIFVD